MFDCKYRWLESRDHSIASVVNFVKIQGCAENILKIALKFLKIKYVFITNTCHHIGNAVWSINPELSHYYNYFSSYDIFCAITLG